MTGWDKYCLLSDHLAADFTYPHLILEDEQHRILTKNMLDHYCSIDAPNRDDMYVPNMYAEWLRSGETKNLRYVIARYQERVWDIHPEYKLAYQRILLMIDALAALPADHKDAIKIHEKAHFEDLYLKALIRSGNEQGVFDVIAKKVAQVQEERMPYRLGIFNRN